MDRVISPPASDLAKLRQPLTAGERAVLDVFARTLDPEWEIYIQPHLNGLRPDFVLLHPRVGIGVFEVKDWDLDAMEYFVAKRPRPQLWARKDGKVFSLQKNNPVTKVEYYRQSIFDLYCPRLQAKTGFAAITAGVIFPFAEKQRVLELFAPFLKEAENNPFGRYSPVSGAEQVSEARINEIFPESSRTHSSLMRPEIAKDLRGWLVEPDFAANQRRPLEMDANQRQLATSRTETGLRRIKGSAGSGKSVVLAARAAALADEGRRVLVASFNITLWHYLRDLVVRALRKHESYRNIEFANFHSWCSFVCSKVGWDDAYNDLWKGFDHHEVLEKVLPNLVRSAAGEPGAPAYDAILVDEGQDYRPLWWNTLRSFLKPGGEMLMVADATQDIYGTAGAWTDEAMTGAGFRGSWSRLDVSYRLPPSAVPAFREFAQRFIPDQDINLPEPQQGSLDLLPCRLRWIHCQPEQAVETSVAELMRIMHFTGEDAQAYADITFLAADVASGSAVVDELDKRGIKSVATFAEDTKVRRREKVGFYQGDARIKATTLHSFKGWEAPLLVINIGETMNRQGLALAYTGMTRLKSSSAGSRLTIISSCADLVDYGRSWPNFLDVSHGGQALPSRLSGAEAGIGPKDA